MRWHHEDASKDGIMRHLVDSPTWKSIDSKWPNASHFRFNTHSKKMYAKLFLEHLWM